MKGYYQISIRRAINGAVRLLSFHNHIMPDFFEILMAKQVADNSNSVIDTLVFGDGVGTHPANATALNGSIVYEKKYNDYVPPANLAANLAATEFMHVFRFNGFNTTPGLLQVGEVAIGARVNGEFKIASMIHIQDANGEPSKLILMPGDEIDVTWSLIIARPAYIAGFESAPMDFVTGNTSGGVYNGVVVSNIDYEMFVAYPNWQLMGLKRVLALCANRNALVTKTPWEFRYGGIVVDPTAVQLRAGITFQTDNTIPGYVAASELYVPSIIGPIRLAWSNTESRFTNALGLKFVLDNLYTRWKNSFRTTYSEKTEPQLVRELIVSYTQVVGGTGIYWYNVKIKTAPYAFVTVYKNGSVYKNLLADEFGNCSWDVERTLVLSTDKFTTRAHVEGDQLTHEFMFPAPGDPAKFLYQASTLRSGEWPYAQAYWIGVLPSVTGKRFFLEYEFELLPDQQRPNGVTVTNETATYGDVGRIVRLQGNFYVGDKVTFKLKNSTTNALLETLVLTVDQVNMTNKPAYPKTDISDQLFLSVKAI